MTVPGKLYICATPIGNMDDSSTRLADTLGHVGLIAAEDTRVTQSLLAHFQIRTPLISLQKYNEFARTKRIIDTLNTGVDVAVVSDAGTPNIADPGAILVQKVRAEGLDIIPIPGPCSLATFISVSGILANQFIFGGFFPKKNQQATALIRSAGTNNVPIVFFETAKRLMDTLAWLKETTPVMTISLGKELTKKFELIMSGSLDEIHTDLVQHSDRLKGEWCMMFTVEPTPPYQAETVVSELRELGLTSQQIMAVSTRYLDLARNTIYDHLHTSAGN